MKNQFEPLGCAIVIIRKGRVALCKRIDPTREFCGQWAFAGGGVEDDELWYPAIGAAREVEEETGHVVAPNSLQYLEVHDSLGGVFLKCIYYAAFVEESVELANTEPHKHSDWQWFTYEEVLKLDTIASIPALVEKVLRYE